MSTDAMAPGFAILSPRAHSSALHERRRDRQGRAINVISGRKAFSTG